MYSSSDDDSSDSSDEGDTGLAAYMAKTQQKRGDISRFEGFEEGDEGSVVEMFKQVLALREQLGTAAPNPAFGKR